MANVFGIKQNIDNRAKALKSKAYTGSPTSSQNLVNVGPQTA